MKRSRKPVNRFDKLIRKCRSWDDFVEMAEVQPNTVSLGGLFERLTQLYLLTQPEYQTKLKNIWLLSEVPPNVSNRLNLPEPDEGIDLIAETFSGEYWSIQCKYRSNLDKALTYRELSTFSTLSFVNCKNVALGVIVHTSTKPIRKRKQLGNVTEIGLDRWLEISAEGWAAIRARARGRSLRPRKRTPRPHQKSAIRAAKKHFITSKESRGRMTMPCGSGKSLVAFWIAREFNAKTIIVAVPSLTLIKQSLSDWTREFLAQNIIPEWLCVCSDESVGTLEKDQFVADAYEMGVPATTNPDEIISFLKRKAKTPKIIFTTYQSSQRLSEAAKKARNVFDLCILDEAHKTVGAKDKAFATLIFEENIKIRRRLFMTATERIYRGNSDDVLSMDDEALYGSSFHKLSFKKAIEDEIICDYQVLTVAVTDERIKTIVRENRLLSEISKRGDEREAKALAAGVALMRTYRNQGVKHAISFHRSIKAAEEFRDQQDELNEVASLRVKASNLNVSSKYSVGERTKRMQSFVNCNRALMTNARCLTEGVDIPAIDCVLFVDPKYSVVDVVQAAGRAMRPNKEAGKKRGYILLPIVVPKGKTFEEFAETTEFRTVTRTIAALSTQDERIAEEFRTLTQGRKRRGKIIKVTGDVPLGLKISFEDFAEAVTARVWESVARINFRPFEDARTYVQSLNLKKQGEWFKYTKSGNLPADIPTHPDRNYTDKGWVNWGDWLGTGSVATFLREFRSFKEAREFTQSLNLMNQDEWRLYTKSGDLPDDIPANPNKVYKSRGWVGMGDWLGTGRFANRYREFRSFKEAREFVRSLNLKSNMEWRTYTKSGDLPGDIPTTPELIYKGKGWASYGDWLGTGTVATGRREFRPFKKARAFAQKLDLNNGDEWTEYAKSEKRPADIPAYPEGVYKGEGWAGMGDWLGTGTVAPSRRVFRPFEMARAFVRSLNMNNRHEWTEYTKSGDLPGDIPTHPDRTYKDKGWVGMGDWLGTGTVANRNRKFSPFKKAQAFARNLNLKNEHEWRTYTKSGDLPGDIPTHPDRTYKDKGWVGMGDWLGTGTDFSKK